MASHSVFPNNITNAIEGLSRKLSGLSVVPHVQNNHRIMPKGTSLPKSVMLDQSSPFVKEAKARKGIASMIRTIAMKFWTKQQKKENQGEEKRSLLIRS